MTVKKAKTARKTRKKRTSQKQSVVQGEKVLFTWTQKARPFTKRSREYWVSTFAIAALAGFILLIIEGIISVFLVVAVVFLFYILNTVEPEKIDYQITSYGIRVGEKLMDYSSFLRYWFTDRNNDTLLVFQTVSIPGRFELVINKKDKTQIRKHLNTYLLEEKAVPTRLDKMTDWVTERLPMN